MNRKGKHRAKKGYLLGYPVAWYVAQIRNRKALRAADKRVLKARRKLKREAFWFDLREWFLQDD